MPPKQANTRGRKRSAPTSVLSPISDLSAKRRQLRPYTGKHAKLVLSIDVGTTFSAASFCILRPRYEPKLEIVSSWPGQNDQSKSDYKIPSVIYYDKTGKPTAWGAETQDPDIKADASRNNWYRVEWFKLALKPPHLTVESSQFCDSPLVQLLEPSRSLPLSERHVIPELPSFLTAHQVYKDFLGFMLEHIREHIPKHHAGGAELWLSLFPTMEVVFTLPSGWEMKQQHEMRIAAVNAGFMGPSTEDASNDKIGVGGEARREFLMSEAIQRIKFVSEPEAAMVHAAGSGYIDSWLKVGEDVILCDAGGGTIDITAYTILKTRPLQLKEKYASKCIIAGAVLINQCAREYLAHKILTTAWDNAQRLEHLMDEFESDTKKRFQDPSREYGLGKGGDPETYKTANVRNGRIYIPGKDLEKFFLPTLSAIQTGIYDIFKTSKEQTKNVVMVGGFMNSSYAYTQLEKFGNGKGLKFAKPDGAMAKAVSFGALDWYLTKPVQGYILKAHYGIEASLPVCDVPDEELVGRNTIMESDGTISIDGGWSTIASMGDELDPMIEIASNYERYIGWDERAEGYKFEEKVYLCRAEVPPTFLTSRTGHLNSRIEHICSIIINLEELFHSTRWELSKKDGRKFKRLEFVICIRHNGYDIDAYAYWMIKGERYIGDAKVVVPGIFNQ